MMGIIKIKNRIITNIPDKIMETLRKMPENINAFIEIITFYLCQCIPVLADKIYVQRINSG